MPSEDSRRRVEASDHLSALSPEADRRDLRILQAFRRIIRAIDLHSRKLEADHRITTPQLVALNIIGEADDMYPSELAQRMHLSPSTVVGILDRLERKKYINRLRSTEDRRRVHVALTESGREVIAQAPSPLQDRLADALARLPELEQEEIATALDKVVALMEARDLDAAPILQTGPILPETDS